MTPVKTKPYKTILLNPLIVKTPFIKAIIGIVIIIGLSACSTTKLAALQNEPAYLAGFGDGCQTAQEAEKSFSTKRVRDEYAFKDDEAYQLGWRAGLLQCNYPNDDFTARGGRIFGEDANF